MKVEEGYNGWANYETWAMALWIDNDEGTYLASREIARDAAKGPHPTLKASEALSAWMYEAMPNIRASVWSDLLSASWARVDWYEIAENFLEEART